MNWEKWKQLLNGLKTKMVQEENRQLLQELERELQALKQDIEKEKEQ